MMNMTRTNRFFFPIPGPVLAVAAALILAGCSYDVYENPKVGKADYRDGYPLKVRLATAVLATGPVSRIKVPGSRERNRLRGFVTDYLRRGRGPLEVSLGGNGTQDAVLQLRAVLAEEGVRPADIEFKPAASKAAGDGKLIFRFSGYVVSVPECGDWSGAAGFDPSNMPHTNFGCSYQRNMGLMLADPGDLVEPREPVRMDSQRSDAAIKAYRAGASAGADLPKNEIGNISIIKGTGSAGK